LSIVQGPFSVAPCPTLISRFATFCIAVQGPPGVRLGLPVGASGPEAGRGGVRLPVHAVHAGGAGCRAGVDGAGQLGREEGGEASVRRHDAFRETLPRAPRPWTPQTWWPRAPVYDAFRETPRAFIHSFGLSFYFGVNLMKTQSDKIDIPKTTLNVPYKRRFSECVI
jgi:hypothetical protein